MRFATFGLPARHSRLRAARYQYGSLRTPGVLPRSAKAELRARLFYGVPECTQIPSLNQTPNLKFDLKAAEFTGGLPIARKFQRLKSANILGV